MRFTINNNKYHLTVYWDTLTLCVAEKVVALDYDAELIESALKAKWLEHDKQQMEYVADVLAVLSDCPKDVLLQTQPAHLAVLFDAVYNIVDGLYNFNLETYKPLGVEKIKWQGQTYVMPKNLKIENEIMACYKEPAKNITEAGNFVSMIHEMKYKGISVMKYICAYYLKRPNDGVISDELAAERAEMFRELPMSIVWEVFFCTYFSFINSAINFRLSFVKQSRAQRIINMAVGFWLWLKRALSVTFSKSKRKASGKLRQYSRTRRSKQTGNGNK